MAEYRKTIAYTKNLIKQELFSAKTLAVYGFLFALCGCACYPMTVYLVDSGEQIGYWEMADCILGSHNTQLFYLLGILVLISGIPYAGKETPYYLIRGRKQEWVTSNVLLLLCHTICYYGFLCICIAIYILPGICMDNRWSDLYASCKNGKEIGNVWMNFSEQAYNVTTPLSGFLVLLTEAVLCSVWMGMLVFLFSMYGKRKAGMLLCVILFGLNRLLDYGLHQLSFFRFVKYINPVSFLTQYWMGEPEAGGRFGYAVAFLGVVIVATYVAVQCRMKKSDWMVEA